MALDRQKKILIAAGVVLFALALPAALVLTGGLKMWRETRAPAMAPEQASALREAAERAVDAALPVPTLSADAIEMQCAPENIEAEVQRVVRLAAGVGGAASSWNDGQTLRIIAKVPEDAEAIFRDAVNRGIYDMKVAQGSRETTVVEVLIKPVGGH